MTDHEEMLELVDHQGNVTGLASRSEVHRDPALLHKVVHVLVFNCAGELLLQKRANNKDVAPGKWDTSVGGHVNPGEDLREAALREMEEELGITGCDISFLYSHLFSNSRESELVSTFSCVYDGVVRFNTGEIDAVEYWGLEKIKCHMGREIFSAHFESEITTYMEFIT